MNIPTPKRRPPTPGEILWLDFLKPLGVTQLEFAKHLGVTPARLNETIKGKRAITPDMALRLERVLGPSVTMWLNMQQLVDVWDAMHSERAAEIKRLKPLKKTAA